MLHTPFYDPKKSYDENYEKGPFGAFKKEKFTDQGEPQYDFLGQKIYLPFGIPAGPLINSEFCKGAFDLGFDICVYKTVRSDTFPCHPYPNVLPVELDGDLTLERAQKPLIVKSDYSDPLSITNSFGVPSKASVTWQEDVKKAISYARKGQVLVLSFMGTVKSNQTQEEFIADYALAAKQAMETGAKVLETNLSCPNIGNEGLVCYNLEVTEKVSIAIRKVIGKVPLILKVGYYKDEDQLKKLAEIAAKYADAVSLINTIQAEILDDAGKQALPGKNRLRSGVCGAGIKWAGLDMVRKIKKIRDRLGANFKIIGVGGVMSSGDYFDYVEAGADAVMSATGAMWNPYLAKEIKEIS